MNLFARILSHGFGLILVALLALGLVYRGDLFPGLKLPAFLTFEQTEKHETGTPPATTAGTMPSPAASQAGPAETPQAEAAVVTPEQEAGGSAPEAGSGGQKTDTTIEPEPTGGPMQQEERASAIPEMNPPAAPAREAEDSGMPAGVTESQPAPPAAAEQESQVAPSVEVPPAVPAAAAPGTEAATPAAAEQEPQVAPSGEVPPAVPAAAAPGTETVTPAAAEQEPQVAPPGEVPPAVPVASAPGPEAATPATTAGEQPPASAEPAAGIAQQMKPAVTSAAVPETAPGGPESSRPAETETATRVPPGATPEATRQPAQAGAPGEKSSPYRVLEAARESYWLRDYATAEKQYNDLISMEPDNPDWYGELGNMYFSQGEWDKASTAYYEAGVRLLKQGMTSEAQQLVEVIRGLKGSQAADLEQKIKEATASAP